ncbi:hypothetical protein DJ82_10785 [Halorubrum sp. Ib24]|uniref:hypothetical protein n=1 Tax=unclassified Halorubrum TaxID=2642239 RepID=UPI000B97FDD3|nr:MULTISPECIES: hypothetical protein [unclassified Halorubrum]OYR38918.1 hypothetical protein DJ82_10785 [Halorubrum sp. Ib24]OYR43823.1 hypothetical protein DJ74_18350 [Halorubrum sp. Ea8]OYR44204.1 hypothetical protein DJ81_07600 [Halorubrum sp. Hd13]OYR49631.1 hypothetical protein DJ73_17125 [Halorubrum sp. Ea1]
MASTERIGETSIGTYREYVMDVRVVELDGGRYRFEAPRHDGIEFGDAETAELYADIYFDVNGFEEAGTGDRGVPPIIIQAGRDTLAAYLLTQPYADRQWVGSFMGVQPGKIERYASRVRKRADNIRRNVSEMEDAETDL